MQSEEVFRNGRQVILVVDMDVYKVINLMRISTILREEENCLLKLKYLN